MLHLIFCWAWKIWKAQGRTIRGKVIIHLGRGEKEHVLSYVAMSRVTHFSDIGLYEGITHNCLCKLTKAQNNNIRINAELCFCTLFTRTQEFLRNL